MTQISLPKLELDEIDPSLQAMLRPAAERLGYFGEMFQYLANGPEALKAFMAYSGAMRGTVDGPLNELIALTVCTRMGFPYERIQHERLSLTMGLDREWIAALVDQGPADPLSPAERDAQALVLALTDGDYDEARGLLEPVVSHYGREQAVSLLLQASRFMTVCSIGRLLDAALPVSSIFDDAEE